MESFFTKIIEGIVGFLFGALATMWWNRARPLTVLQGFADVVTTTHEVPISEELSELSEEVWEVPSLPAGTCGTGLLQVVVNESREALEKYEDALEKLPALVERLRRASEAADMIPVLEAVFSHTGISDALDYGLKTGDLLAAPTRSTDGGTLIQISETSKNDGGF